MKVIFDDLADYVVQEWNLGDIARRELLNELCEKIRKNSKNIIEGMQNGGISLLHVDDITKKLFSQIFQILKGTNFHNIGLPRFRMQME